jgi:hypothetical protein
MVFVDSDSNTTPLPINDGIFFHDENVTMVAGRILAVEHVDALCEEVSSVELGGSSIFLSRTCLK